MGPNHKYPSKLLRTKTKKCRINEHKKKMDNLYILPNNILTRLFKELKKIYIYKNNYQ